MSPTQQSSQEAFTSPAPVTTFTESSSSSSQYVMEYEILRIPLPTPPEGVNDLYLESELKFVVSEIEKLTRCSGSLTSTPSPPPSMIVYKKVWFEGPLSEKWNAVTGLSLPETNKCEGSDLKTFLCVKREKCGDLMTLEDWLEEREDEMLYEGQLLHIVSQLASAACFLFEAGVALASDPKIELSDIHVILGNVDWSVSHFAPKSGFSFPFVKLSPSTLHFERIISRLSSSQQLTTPLIVETGGKTESENKCSESCELQLLGNLLKKLLEHRHKSKNWRISLETSRVMNDALPFKPDVSLKSLISKLEELKASNCRNNGVVFNVGQPAKTFIGRENEVQSLLQIITTTTNKLIVVHGPSALGKSELVIQVISKILTEDDYDKLGKKNILCCNASSPDNLTASVYNLASSKNLNVPITDYMGAPRLLKDIFLETISSFDESDLLLVVFENANDLSVETMDLIEIFKENRSTRGHHHLILIMSEISRCPLLENSTCVTLPLLPLISQDVGQLLIKDFKSVDTSENFDNLGHKLEGNSAALKIITKHIKATPKNIANPSTSCQRLLNYFDQCPVSPDIQDLRPVFITYSYSLNELLHSLDNNQKGFVGRLLSLLQFVDDCGISVDTLIEVFIQLQVTFDHHQHSLALNNVANNLRALLSSLRRLSIIKISDGLIRVPPWSQNCLKFFLQLTSNECQSLSFRTDINSILSAYFLVLSSKNVESDCWKLIGQSSTVWKEGARTCKNFAKRFDALPDLIGKLAKSFKKLELVTGFLKEAVNIFSSAYNSTSDIHALKLKLLLATDSLLPKSQINEAFTFFKSIQEECSLEPRDVLMIKLKALIELGKIHLSKQQFDKAISCFQRVQILSVQKISILEVDSEPTVLAARLLHGQAHGEEGNLEESKKILLQVIPLLERYSGDDKAQVKLFVLQGKYYLGVILRKTGDLVNALMMQTKVLEEREGLLGDKHPETWSSKREMAMLYSSYDNHDKALLLLRQLLEIQETILGAPSNRHSLATMNSIAEIEAKLGNFDEALELYEAIDLIEQQVLAESDEMRISSQLSQAEVLVSLGQYKEALDIYNLVHTLISSIPSSEGKSRSSQLETIIISKREKCERSMEILGNYWLSLTPENVDDPSELTALAKKHEVAAQLAENLDNQGALRFLREVLEDLESSQTLEPTNRFFLNVKADLARILGLVGKFNESFSVYKEIIPLLDKTFGETDELTMLCKDTMGQVFLFSGNQFLKRQMSNLKWFLV